MRPATIQDTFSKADQKLIRELIYENKEAAQEAKEKADDETALLIPHSHANPTLRASTACKVFGVFAGVYSGTNRTPIPATSEH